MKKLISKLNAWRRNHLFLLPSEATRACNATYTAGTRDTRNGYAEAVMSITRYKMTRRPGRVYDIRIAVDAATLDTEAGDVAGAVAIAEDIAHRIVAMHRRKEAK